MSGHLLKPGRVKYDLNRGVVVMPCGGGGIAPSPLGLIVDGRPMPLASTAAHDPIEINKSHGQSRATRREHKND